jgi:hypothetical protein
MQTKFNIAIAIGDLPEVTRMSHVDGVDVTAQDNYAVRLACTKGHLGVVRYLVEQCPGVDVTADDNYALRWTCGFGHLDVVRYLCENCEGVDVTAENNYADQFARENGHLDVVQYLFGLIPVVTYTRAEFAVTDVCAVCLCEPIRPLMLGCSHVFCVDCIDATRIEKCPMCRAAIVRSGCREHV